MIPLVLVTALTVQSTPQAIPKADLPRKAPCVVCVAKGNDHGEERTAAGVRFRGVAYFFCNPKEVEEFSGDPDGFVPQPLPRPMPAFDLTDRSGTRWQRDSFRNRTILVDFWATWCAPCHKLKPILDRVRSKYAKDGLELLSVSIDEKPADLERFLSKNVFANPVLHDSGQTWSAWRVKSVPNVFLVHDGRVVGQWIGKVDEHALGRAVAAVASPSAGG